MKRKRTFFKSPELIGNAFILTKTSSFPTLEATDADSTLRAYVRVDGCQDFVDSVREREREISRVL